MAEYPMCVKQNCFVLFRSFKIDEVLTVYDSRSESEQNLELSCDAVNL